MSLYIDNLRQYFVFNLQHASRSVKTLFVPVKAAEKMNNCLHVHVWPLGKLMGKSDGLTELLHIPNSAKVVNIKDPQPGMWSIKVNKSFFTWECV